jgi:hypothetical protein
MAASRGPLSKKLDLHNNMSVDGLVDAFVSTINNRGRDPQLPEYVPAGLRVPLLDEFGDEDDLCTDWRIVASDNGSRIASLERRMDKHFPPSCRNLLCRYSFPAFECGPVMFFSNTGQALFWELQDRLFLDRVMSPFLLQAGYIQIGNPMFHDYDPLCLEAQPEGYEGQVVQLDHEAILCNGEVSVVRRVAPSFDHLMQALIAGEA